MRNLVQDYLNNTEVEQKAVDILNQHFTGTTHGFNLSVLVTLVGIYSYSSTKGDLRGCINNLQTILDTLHKTKNMMEEDLRNGN